MKFTILAVGAMLAVITATPSVAEDGAGPKTDKEWREWAPEPAAVAMPGLAFSETPADTENYKKYYYFYRADTSFGEALADIRECDEYARGLFGGDYSLEPSYVASYGLGGVLGGAIGSALADAIYGSAEERRKRRVNMRRCMNFKGYQRYGLSKDLWNAFNFEEGNRTVPEQERQAMLAQQAKVASGPKPVTRELGL